MTAVLGVRDPRVRRLRHLADSSAHREDWDWRVEWFALDRWFARSMGPVGWVLGVDLIVLAVVAAGLALVLLLEILQGT